MAGYGSDTPRTATGTHSPLLARCVVLWDDNPHVIVSVDVLDLPRSMHQSILQQITGNTAPGASDVVIITTHTHNGPVLIDTLDPVITYGADPADLTVYSAWLEDQIVALITAGLSAEQISCTLDYQVTTQSWSANREGLSYTETAVPILTARRTDGSPAVIITSYGCHSVVGNAQSSWDGDYPATTCAIIEAAIPGCFAMFVPGAAGDQDPVGARSWAAQSARSAQLGSAVVSAVATVGRVVTGPIVTSHQEVNLPLDVSLTPDNLAAVRAIYVERSTNTSLPVWYRRHALEMIADIDNGNTPTSVPLPTWVWKFSGSPMLRVCMIGGELVSGYAMYLRTQFGGDNGIMICAYAGETTCYVPSNELLPPMKTGGSYAGGWDTDHSGVAGGSQTIYRHMGHFLSGTSGVESALISAVTGQLT